MTIYIVEDEPNIRELVEYTLRASGHEALGFAEAQPFYTALASALPDLVLLDIMLPGEDGLAILRKLKADKKTQKLPVIMLTAKNSEYDKVLGLDAGADDYVVKPFGMMELLSRIKAVQRRVMPSPEKERTFTVGALTLLPERHVVMVEEKSVELTFKEFELLQLLLETPGFVFTRDVIMDRVWGYSYEGDSRTVDVHIRSLRQKLGSSADCIETVRGVGYRIGKTV